MCGKFVRHNWILSNVYELFLTFLLGLYCLCICKFVNFLRGIRLYDKICQMLSEFEIKCIHTVLIFLCIEFLNFLALLSKQTLSTFITIWQWRIIPCISTTVRIPIKSEKHVCSRNGHFAPNLLEHTALDVALLLKGLVPAPGPITTL